MARCILVSSAAIGKGSSLAVPSAASLISGLTDSRRAGIHRTIPTRRPTSTALARPWTPVDCARSHGKHVDCATRTGAGRVRPLPACPHPFHGAPGRTGPAGLPTGFPCPRALPGERSAFPTRPVAASSSISIGWIPMTGRNVARRCRLADRRMDKVAGWTPRISIHLH